MITTKESTVILDREETDHVLYNSLRAVYHFERNLISRFGFGFQEVYLLQLLRRQESACVGEIAKALDVHIFTITRLTQKLAAAGLISKRRCEKDRRSVAVKLEPKGESLIADIEAYNYDLIIGKTLSSFGDNAEHVVLVARNLERILGVGYGVDEDSIS